MCAFQAQPLHSAGAPVFLLAAGEIDASHGGPELLAVLADGSMLRLDAGEAGWTVQPIPIAFEPSPIMNFRPTINIGDVHTGFAGNEIIVELDDTVNVLVQPSPGQWQRQIVLDDKQHFGVTWGVRIGDIDPAQPGHELFYILEGAGDVSSGHYARLVDGTWSSSLVFNAEVGMDSAIGDTNPAFPGNEIIVGTEMGPVYEIVPQPGNPLEWPRQTLWDNIEHAPWTIRIADVLPNLPGQEIVYGSRYTNSFLLSREAPIGHQMDVLFTGQATGSNMNIWDIAVGDVVPESPSLEIVGVDDAGYAYLVQHNGESWSGAPLWQDEGGGLFAVVMADFLPNSPGPEIVVAGQSGAITLITRHDLVIGDINCDGIVNVADLLAVIGAWGPCPNPDDCPADIAPLPNGDDVVNVTDLLTVISHWG